MDLHIFRFFEKPFDVQRLYASLDKAMEFLDDSYVDIFLEKNNEYIKIPVDNICYIKRENRCISVVTKNGTFITKGDFNNLISKLPNTYFYLVHKSFMINVHHVTKYSYKEIYIGKDRIGIATRKQADFHKFWFNYVKGDSMVYNIAVCVTYFFEMFIAYIFFSQIGDKKVKTLHCFIIGTAIFETGAIFNIVLSNIILFNALYFLFINFIYGLICFKIKISRILFML